MFTGGLLNCLGITNRLRTKSGVNDQSFPHEVKSCNGRVRIYRLRSNGCIQFRVANYLSGKRKLETFSKFRPALKRARAILTELKKPPRRRT